MATHTLVVQSFATSPNFQADPIEDYWTNQSDPYSFNGDTDGGVCLQAIGDGKDVTNSATNMPPTLCYFEDDSVIPALATISSVQLTMQAKGTGITLAGASFFSNDVENSVSITGGTLGPTYSTLTTNALTTSPGTGLSWTRAELFSDNDAGFRGNGAWGVRINLGAGTTGFDYFGLIVTYVGGSSTWYFNPATNHYQYVASDPGSPWIEVDPTMSELTIQPTSGSTTGGD